MFVFDTNISLADLFLSLSFLCKCSFPFLYFFSTGKSTVCHHNNCWNSCLWKMSFEYANNHTMQWMEGLYTFIAYIYVYLHICIYMQYERACCHWNFYKFSQAKLNACYRHSLFLSIVNQTVRSQIKLIYGYLQLRKAHVWKGKIWKAKEIPLRYANTFMYEE